MVLVLVNYYKLAQNSSKIKKVIGINIIGSIWKCIILENTKLIWQIKLHDRGNLHQYTVLRSSSGSLLYWTWTCALFSLLLHLMHFSHLNLILALSLLLWIVLWLNSLCFFGSPGPERDAEEVEEVETRQGHWGRVPSHPQPDAPCQEWQHGPGDDPRMPRNPRVPASGDGPSERSETEPGPREAAADIRATGGR